MSNTKFPKGRAIVTFSRTWQALTCIRSLGMRGIDVIAADEFSTTPGSLSRYSSESFTYTNPLLDEAAFLADIDAAIDRFHPGDGVPYVLIPTQRETGLLAKHADRFQGRIAIATPSIDLIEKVSDKGWLADYAAQQGLAVPQTLHPDSFESLREQLSTMDFPVVVKIRSGIGGIGLKLCHTAEEAVQTFNQFVEEFELAPEQYPIIQEAVEGDDYCVGAIAHRATPIGITTYQNVGKLSDGGPGMIRETVKAPGAEAAAATLLKALDWHGVAQIDFVWTGRESDPAYLIELNARLFAGLFQVVASGVDFPWMLFEMAAGKTPEPAEPEIGVKTETPVLGLLSTLKDVAEELNPGSHLESAWQGAADTWRQGRYMDAINQYMDRLTDADALEDRVNRVKALLEEREGNLTEFFDEDDPRATLGLLFPLAAYLKYGKVSRDVLTGLKAP